MSKQEILATNSLAFCAVSGSDPVLNEHLPYLLNLNQVLTLASQDGTHVLV